ELGLDVERRIAARAVVVGLVAGVAEREREVRRIPRRQRSLPAEIRLAAEQHVAAGRANRRHVAAEAVGVGEAEAALYQRIDGRRFDGRIAERADGIGALVV